VAGIVSRRREILRSHSTSNLRSLRYLRPILLILLDLSLPPPPPALCQHLRWVVGGDYSPNVRFVLALSLS
jgi:hypothetical protein